MTIDVNALFITDTAAALLNKGLDLAQAIGLPVTSWRAGDPTRSLYQYLAEVLATLEGSRAEFIKAGFLSTASGDWLTVLASDVYGVDRREATYSTPSVVLHNAGGGQYPIDPGELTLKSTATGATFHNTSGGLLVGGASITLTLTADSPGSVGTVVANEIDALVTTLLGVTVSSSTAAIGLDEQDDPSLKSDCRDSRGALSPNGPADAYDYVARNPKLTGVSTITRSRATSYSATGHVTVYVAGPNGGVSGADVLAAQAAIETWATPLCVTPTVVSAAETVVNVTGTIHGDDVPADFLARESAALAVLFSGLPIADAGGDSLAVSLLVATLHAAIPLKAVVLSAPAADVTIPAGHVPKLGTVTITEI